MGPRIYANLPKEFVEKIRDDPNNKGYRPEIDAIEELEYRAAQETMQKIQADIQKLTKPHWTLTPTFWLVLLTALVVPFQLWQYVFPVVKSLIRPATSIQSSSQLQSTGTSTTKTSPPNHVQKKP